MSRKQDAEALYRAIAHQLGLRVRKVTRESSYQRAWTFTGHTIQPYYRADEHSWLVDVAHELGHAIVAPPRRRRLPEFGFGTSYELLGAGPVAIDGEHAFEEEALASLVGILLTRRVQGHDTALEVWYDHSWGEGSTKALRILRSKRGRRAVRLMRQLLRRCSCE